MKSLQQLKEDVLKDGIIDAGEVLEMHGILFDDGKIDIEEAEMLFEINDAVSGKENHASWQDLFVKALTSYVLDDEDSRYEIDEIEAKWLYDHIKSDGAIDANERKLLINLIDNSKNFPQLLASLL